MVSKLLMVATIGQDLRQSISKFKKFCLRIKEKKKKTLGANQGRRVNNRSSQLFFQEFLFF
jgi:hypothetical protein